MREAQRQAWAKTEKEMTSALNTDDDNDGGYDNTRMTGCCRCFILTNSVTCPNNLRGGSLSPPPHFPGEKDEG